MRVCMVSYSFFENDNRVRRYTSALVKAGDHIDVVSLRKPGQKPFARVIGADVYRIQTRDTHERREKLAYLLRLCRFFVKSTVWLALRHLKRPYDVIHVHSVPDFEVFAAFVPRLLGCKVVLDIHDIVPEFYCSKFGVLKGSAIFRLLVFVERCSIAFAHHVIISNHIWQKRLLDRSVKPAKCTAVMNYPDADIFRARRRPAGDGAFVMMYPGTINFHQGLDIAVRAFHRIRDRIPRARFDIYGDGPDRRSLEELIEQLGLSERIRVHDVRPMQEIAGLMAGADLGVIPKRNDTFGDEAFSTKSLEFMSVGVPLLMAETRIDRLYFNDQVVEFFKPGSDEDLAGKMLSLYERPGRLKELAENGGRFVQSWSWDRRQDEYFAILKSLRRPSSKRRGSFPEPVGGTGRTSG